MIVFDEMMGATRNASTCGRAVAAARMMMIVVAAAVIVKKHGDDALRGRRRRLTVDAAAAEVMVGRGGQFWMTRGRWGELSRVDNYYFQSNSFVCRCFPPDFEGPPSFNRVCNNHDDDHRKIQQHIMAGYGTITTSHADDLCYGVSLLLLV